jgi:nitroimidazol reductase NimA-like FMN-containing flavoprotein (pyridoxamine 5'-phosphate oxidase superfamily)
MLIEQLTREESLAFVAEKRLVRLGCAHDGQPYVMPIRIARDDARFYCFSTVGQKIEWMRANPLVCVQADEIQSLENWCSVLVFGRYAELPKTPEYEAERHHAHTLLWRDSEAWEPGYARTIVHGKTRELETVYFRIDVSDVSGRRATPECQSLAR